MRTESVSIWPAGGEPRKFSHKGVDDCSWVMYEPVGNGPMCGVVGNIIASHEAVYGPGSVRTYAVPTGGTVYYGTHA